MSSEKDSKRPGPEPEVLNIETDPESALSQLLGKNWIYAVTYFMRGGEYLDEPVATAETAERAKEAAEKWWRDNDCGENVSDGEQLVLLENRGTGMARTLATFIGVRWSA